MKQILVLLLISMVMTGCLFDSGSRSGSGGESDIIFSSDRRETSQPLTVNSSSVLPPYGVRVQADTAILTVNLRTNKAESAAMLADLEAAMAHITTETEAHETISLVSQSVSQLMSQTRSYDYGSSETRSYIMLDGSNLSLQLAVNLANYEHDLLGVLTAFNDFLAGLRLAESIEAEATSLETRVSAPEQYRQQIIAQVYAELAAVQAEHGESYQFDVSGLHAPLLSMRLNDTTYYLYLEPTINGRDF